LDNALISCDLPLQVSDINNDGHLEVVYAKDFEIFVADLLTGKTLYSFKTPKVKDDVKVGLNYPFDYLNVDALRVADFTKKGYQGDLMVKDRYSNVWGLNGETGEVLFQYHHKNTGHFPYVIDIDNDGIDELLIGYDLVKNNQILWTLPFNSDHTDEIIYEKVKEHEPPVFLLASGNEGFNAVSKNGEVLKSLDLGHVQRISLANFNPNTLNNDICVSTFWGANQIVYLLNSNYEITKQKEFTSNGYLISPINYDNSETALILTNTSSQEGGLLDHNLDIVVNFPDDGHPTLASEVYDFGDGIDAVLTWDLDQLWIYKASKIKPSKTKYRRYPKNAFSNYRGEFLVKE
jgi:hypothetical protein